MGIISANGQDVVDRLQNILAISVVLRVRAILPFIRLTSLVVLTSPSVPLFQPRYDLNPHFQHLKPVAFELLLDSFGQMGKLGADCFDFEF